MNNMWSRRMWYVMIGSLMIAYFRFVIMIQHQVVVKESEEAFSGLPHRTKEKEHNIAFLTIAVDSYVSCPAGCTFAHHYVPPWVRYRYINFQDEKDLNIALQNDRDSHLLIVARTNIINLSSFANERREQTRKSVALWHMADERVFHGEILNPYRNFDYVIRNYWRWKQDFDQQFGMKLRALGNHTCGDSPPLPTSNELEPRFGVHWALLGPHEEHELLRLSASSVWPTSRRPVNCAFRGRGDVKRSQNTRKMMVEAMNEAAPELNCTMEFTAGFSGGVDKWSYIVGDLQNTKIGLSPGGSSVETHRFTECLQMGTVPAVVDQPYLNAPFKDVPVISGSNWTDVATEMKRLVVDEQNGGRELETLSLEGAKFYEDLRQCMKSDLDFILELIVAHYAKTDASPTISR